ncbi:hypothetical protein QR680_000016 [Steinernema hermaphroditum]|uniref:SUZ domain-containing protein n=1 Tax=Steinernema hermaphroditum TaxID=289476 RepID=A0AA39GSZ3_9BILA|nr:hypothetical protein QR680_000016 [Steinernema hermaphroditum]
MADRSLDAALDLMRRLPPQGCEYHLADLITLKPHLCEDLLSAVDQPLKIARDKDTGREYLLCDYNRDEDSYRSPWTNHYDPPLEDGAVPSDKLRKLEIEANAAFEAYRDMYFEGGVSSVYFWDLEYGFAGVVLIKKESGCAQGAPNGCWDSIHVIEILEKANGRQAHYKLTSTVMLWLQTNRQTTGSMNVGGSMTRQTEQDFHLNDQNPHLVNIGKMIEEQESKMRSTLNDVYFGKTRQIVGDLRTVETSAELKNRDELSSYCSSVLQSTGYWEMSECPSKTQRKDDEIADNWEDVGDEQLSAQVEQKQKIIKKQKEAEEELRKLSVQDAMASGRDSPSTSSPEIPQSFKILRRPQSSSSLRQERRANKTDLSANDKLKSLQERQAAYQEARDRIFGDKSNVESCQDGNSDGRISSTPPPVERTEPPKRNTSKNHLSDVPMKEIAPVSQTWDLSHSSALTQTAYQQYLSAQGHNFQQSMVIPPRMMGISANVPQGPCYPGSSSIGINATQNTVYMPNYGYTQNHQISSLGNLQPSNQQSVPGVQTTVLGTVANRNHSNISKHPWLFTTIQRALLHQYQTRLFHRQKHTDVCQRDFLLDRPCKQHSVLPAIRRVLKVA